MYQKLLIVVLCLLYFGGCLASKKTKRDADFQKSNTMSRGKGEHHLVKPDGEINIDETHDGEEIEGSANLPSKQDDDLESSGHGVGADDEDADEGSADHQTKCQKLRAQFGTRQLLGAFVPECATNGDFKAKQCSGSTGHCWCVDVEGREIDGTRQRSPSIPDCSQTDITVSKTLPPDDNEVSIQKMDVEQDKAENPDVGYSVTTESADSNIIKDPTGTPESDPNAVQGAVGPETKVENTNKNDGEGAAVYGSKQQQETDANSVGAVLQHPGILAGIIGGAVVGLLCAILLVMFIVYRMRKKDEGSYALDEPKRSPPLNSYSRSTNREFYA